MLTFIDPPRDRYKIESIGAVLPIASSADFIIAVAAIIHPTTVAWRKVAVALVFGLMALVFTYPSHTGFIERRRGVLLLVLYAAYLITLLQWQAV